jgi:hypothetical protein
MIRLLLFALMAAMHPQLMKTRIAVTKQGEIRFQGFPYRHPLEFLFRCAVVCDVKQAATVLFLSTVETKQCFNWDAESSTHPAASVTNPIPGRRCVGYSRSHLLLWHRKEIGQFRRWPKSGSKGIGWVIPQKSSRLRPWARKCKDPECLTSPKLPVEPEVQKTTRLNPLLRTILAGQKGLEVGGPSALLHESFEVYQNLASLDNCQFSAKTLWQGEVARNFKYLEVREPGKVLQPLHKPLKFHSYNFLLASNTLSMQ